MRRFINIGILALTITLAGCEGGGMADSLPDGGIATLPRTDAGTAYCQIPTALASIKMVDAKGNPTSTTMGSYYDQAAQTGSTGKWGIVTNLSDLSKECSSQSLTSSQCADSTKYCLYATCTVSQDPTTKAWTQLCHVAGYEAFTNSLQVAAALCTPAGQFAGMLCNPCAYGGCPTTLPSGTPGPT